MSYTSFAQIGIGTTSPHPSAEVDVNSSDKGFLVPRLTTLQRDAISNPSPGLIIYNTDTRRFQGFSELNQPSSSLEFQKIGNETLENDGIPTLDLWYGIEWVPAFTGTINTLTIEAYGTGTLFPIIYNGEYEGACGSSTPQGSFFSSVVNPNGEYTMAGTYFVEAGKTYTMSLLIDNTPTGNSGNINVISTSVASDPSLTGGVKFYTVSGIGDFCIGYTLGPWLRIGYTESGSWENLH